MSTQAIAHTDFQTVRALAESYEMQPWIDRLEDTWLRLITQLRDNTPEADRPWAGSMENTLRSYADPATIPSPPADTSSLFLLNEPAGDLLKQR